MVLAAGKDHAEASLIFGSSHPTDLHPIAGNLGTEMVRQKVGGAMQRLMVISANDIHRRPTQHAAADKLDLIAWRDCPPSWGWTGGAHCLPVADALAQSSVVSDAGTLLAWSRQRKRALRG